MRAPLALRLGSIAVLLAIAAGWFLARGPREERGAPEGPPAARTHGAPPRALPAPDHVGRAVCARCHAAEHETWLGSHHDLAMQEVDEAPDLGDFSGVTIVHGETYRFSRDGSGRPQVEISSEGRIEAHPVRYFFGVTPLAQVLLERPGGRLQALPIAWATDAAAGGARWFPLHPDEPTLSGDPFHWSGLPHNWNHQCAECHSTALAKGYDAATDSFSTTWTELDVSCEACHGAGAEHVRWAMSGGEIGEAKGFPLRLRRDPDARWVRTEGEPTAHREPPLDRRPELDACGRCHSRRAALADRVLPGRSLHDTHRLELLSEELYFPDGQIRDEVYVLGSFLQSRMHGAGVTCSDCHDPHSAALHVEGNGLCAGCHDPGVFDVPEHHHHPAGSAGAACVECHMPARTYMGVDPRRDHSFRVPRPDLSATLGVPNPCTGCHAEKDAAWAAATVREWFPLGRSGTPHFAAAFSAARGGAAEGPQSLVAVAQDASLPAIVRATALEELAGALELHQFPVVEHALGDAGEPLLRRGALAVGEGLPPRVLVALAAPLLGDPALSVRLEAVRVLAPHRSALADPTARERLDRAIAEARAAMRTFEDRPEGCLALGSLALSLGETVEAERQLRRALLLEPAFAPAAANLADLLRSLDRDPEGIAVLEAAIERSPEVAALWHSLGLARVRAGDRSAAVAALRRSVELAPEEGRFAFVLAVALDDAGDRRAAKDVLRRALASRPRDAALAHLLDAFERADAESRPPAN